MKKPNITPAFNEHRHREALSLRFAKGFTKFKNLFDEDFFDTSYRG